MIRGFLLIKKAINAGLVFIFFCFSQLVSALPEGSVINQGHADISINNNAMQIIQHSPRVSIDHSSFNIAKGEQLRFIQPSANSIALNRITDVNPSQILGHLQSNGQIFLINPNGIIFGAGAQVEVGGLVASTLNLNDSDFFSDRFIFQNALSSHPNASYQSIGNAGLLQAAKNGYIALIANNVINNGDIIAPEGHIHLHTADEVILTLNDQVVGIQSTSPTVQGLIENHGLLDAPGGHIVMNSHALDALHSTVINNTGMVRATRLSEEGGEIIIMAAEGDVFNDGLLDVSAGRPNQAAGLIGIHGERIAQRGIISANGQGSGNGGTLTLHARSELFATNGSQASANAGAHGSGGQVVYFSDGRTLFDEGATISTTGGTVSGAGGFVEVSGLLWVAAEGFVDTRAILGRTGEYLIDPSNIEIVAGVTNSSGSFVADAWTSTADNSQIGADNINALLASNNVTINTATDMGGPFGGVGNITINAAIDTNGGDGRSLVFQANNNITVNANICDGGAVCLALPDDSVTMVFAASNDFSMADGVTVNAGGSKISIAQSGIGLTQVSGLNSNNAAGDAISISTNGVLSDTGSGDLDLIAPVGGVTIQAAGGNADLETNLSTVNITSAAVAGNNTLIIRETDDLDVLGLASAGGDISLHTAGGGDINLISNIDLEGGNGATLSFNAVGQMRMANGVQILDSNIASTDSVAFNFQSGGDTLIEANGELASYGGALDFTAGGKVVLGTNTNINSTGGNVSVLAAQDFSIADGAVLNAQAGTLSVNADDAVLEGRLHSDSISAAAVSVSSNAQIASSGGAAVNIRAPNGGISLVAVTGIDIDTSSVLLSVTNATSGNVVIDAEVSVDISNLIFQGGNATINTGNGGDLIISSDLNLEGLNNAESLTLNSANDLFINADLADKTAAVDNTTNLILQAGGSVDINALSNINAGGGKITVIANAANIVNLVSSSSADDAIKITSNTTITGQDGTDITALNGGIVVTAQTGIGAGLSADAGLNLEAAKLTLSNAVSGDVNIVLEKNTNLLDISAAENLVLSQSVSANNIDVSKIGNIGGGLSIIANQDLSFDNSVTFGNVVGDINFQASTGSLILPDTGIHAQSNIQLTAADIRDSTDHHILIAGNDLIYKVTSAQSNATLETAVKRIDAELSNHDLIIKQSGDLNVTDLDADNKALSIENGNLQINSASGDLFISHNISANDLNADGIRAGLIDISVTNGDIDIGTEGSALSILSNNTVDENVGGGLGTDLNSQVAIRLLQAGEANSSQNFRIGDGIGNDVSLVAQGGNIIIDAVGNSALRGHYSRLVLLESDASVLAKSNAVGKGSITLKGVGNSNNALIQADAGRSIELVGLMPDAIGGIEGTVSSVVQVSSSAIDAVSPNAEAAVKEGIAHRNLARLFNAVFQSCDKNKATAGLGVGACGVENTLRHFLGRLMIGNELPIQ